MNNLNACSSQENNTQLPSLHHRRLLWGGGLLEAKQAAQVDLGVDVVGNLALVEEPVEVGLHFGASGDTQAQGEEAAQVLLHGGQLVAVQALLPRLLGPPVLLGEAKKRKISHCTANR